VKPQQEWCVSTKETTWGVKKDYFITYREMELKEFLRLDFKKTVTDNRKWFSSSLMFGGGGK
jgi:hypothetical protein